MNDDPPEWFTDDAREVWAHTLTVLPDPAGVDRDALAVYCCAVADFTRAQRALDQTGVVIRGATGQMVRSPLNAIKQENANVVRLLAREFGLVGGEPPQLPASSTRGWRNAAAAERTIAALRSTGRLEPVDAAAAALVRHIASALDQVDAARWPAQTASFARSQLAALRLLRGDGDSASDDSLDALAAALSAPLGDAAELNRPTFGGRLARIAAVLGQPFQPWQAQVANVAGELDPASGLPAYREVRVTVPRQSGKTTLILVVEVDRSTAEWGGPQHSLYAAQDRNNSRAKWEEQGDMLNKTQLRRMFTVRRQTGLERMVWRNGSTIGITASGETSGHGQTLDLGVIDEAFAQKDERLVQAFRPAMMTRPAAQLWVVSTMGTDESLFLHDRVEDGRAGVEAGVRSGVAYFEWSAGDDDDPDDPQTWWGCMPALGRTVTQATVQADHDSMPADEFARAYLNRRTAGGSPVIDALSWQACRQPLSQLAGLPCFALDVTPARSASSIAVAGWRDDRRRHIEVVDHRPGTEWVVERLGELASRWQPLPVMVDPASPAGSLLVDLAAAGIQTETVNAREYGQACGQLFDAVMDCKVAHLDQPVLNAAVAAARKRVLGDAWAWARKVGADISPLCAATLATYGLVKSGQGTVQVL